MKNVLTELAQTTKHEVVSIDEQTEEIGQSTFGLAEVVGVEELYDGSKVLLRDTLNSDVADFILSHLLANDIDILL